MNTILTDDEIKKLDCVDLERECHEVFSINKASVMEFARAIEAAVLAKLREQEPVYQIKAFNSQTAWHDATEGAYHVVPPSDRRIVYADPLPAVVQVPQGWRLVPVEPTPEMMDAAVQAICYGPEGGFTRISGPYKTWAAMLASSPEAPAQPSALAPWREAVKVAREALQAVLEDTGIAEDDWNRAAFGKGYAALAQLDALEGGG